MGDGRIVHIFVASSDVSSSGICLNTFKKGVAVETLVRAIHQIVRDELFLLVGFIVD